MNYSKNTGKKILNYSTSFGIILFAAMQVTANAEVSKPGNYIIDPDHSSVLFTANHLGYSEMTGRFNSFEGKLTLNKNKSTMDVTIKTSSIDTNHEKRDAHLRSPDFFNVKQFPTINFTSNKIKMNSKGELSSITGQLTLHGKSNTATFSIEAIGAGDDPWGGYRAGYNATTTIKRSDYGMNFMVGGGVGDEVSITLNIETIKK